MEEQMLREQVRIYGIEFADSWNYLSALVFAANADKGFWPIDPRTRNVGEMLALIHSEISEGLEAYRHGNRRDDHLTDRPGLEVELADAVIRILDMAGGLKLDVGGAVLDKLLYNMSRPHKHGKDL